MTVGGKPARAAALAAVLLAAWAGSAAMQVRIDRESAPYRDTPDLLWIRSPQLVKALSLGHDGLLANIYWTRVVQYYGRRVHTRTGEYSLLYPLLDITTTLDPQLLIAYYFGAFFLSQPRPVGAGDPQKAIELLYKGLHANPDQWRLYHFIGFTYYWDLQDYEKAASAYLEGAKNPQAQDWMRVMAAVIAQHGGSRETSYFLWSQIYNTTGDAAIRQNALGHLQSLQAQKDIETLEQLARRFREQYERTPASLEEMVSAGLLQQIPVDPAGFPYQLRVDGDAAKFSLHPESTVDLEYGKAPAPPPAAAPAQ